jgi:two-component system phosphate regulon sensor histidine kinase PhoR
MTKRIFHAVLAVALTALVCCLGLVVGVLHAGFAAQTAAELRAQAVCIARGVEGEGKSYLARQLPDNLRITWVAADGAVLFDNREDPASLGSHADRQEVRQALADGSGSAERYSDTLAQKTRYYALRLADGTVLRVSESQDSVWVLVVRTLQPAALIALLVLALAAWMAGRVSRQIVAPINALDPAAPGDGPVYDELTPLLARIQNQNRQIRAQMEELRRRQEEFAAVTENMGEGLVILDAEERVLFRNAAAERLLCAAPPSGELCALDLSRESAFRRAAAEAVAGRRCEEMLEREGRASQIVATPVTREGQPSGAVLLILDVTEKEQREALRREFTANVSHELKTPLAAISGTAEILAKGLVRPEDIPRFAENIQRSAGRLLTLVNDIIRLSRLDEGSVSEERREIEVTAFVRSILEQLRPAAEQKQVSLRLEGEPCRLQTVPQLAQEILGNLCDNAVAYNRPGGSVAVTVTDAPDAVRVAVADTGIGIPPEARERVFERFYRVDRSRSAGGTGLGLSIVRHAAAYLGARVELESQMGRGSTFTVTFPRLPAEGDRPAPEKPEPTRPAP